jgi:hypothetical protein
MMFQQLFCSPSSKQTKTEDLESSIFECDYDSDATNLYQAIEGEAWVPVLSFLETGKWEHMYGNDPLSPERQSRTWVTRFEPDGTVRWSQLPLHAAIIFSAPKKIIISLINLYPVAVRCTDDQQMLPLHLAFKFGADDSVIAFLLERFPEALFTKNVRGRIPTDIEGPRLELNGMLKQVIRITAEHAGTKHGRLYRDKISNLNDDLNLQTRLNAGLESDNIELEERLARATAELAILKNEYKLLKEQKIETSDPLMSPAQIKPLTFRGQTLRPSPSTHKGAVSTIEPFLSNPRNRREKELNPQGADDNTSTAKAKATSTSFVFGRKKKSSKDDESLAEDTRIDFETKRSGDGNIDSRSSRVISVKTVSDQNKKRNSVEGSLDRSGRSSPLQNFKKELSSGSLNKETADASSNSVATFRTNERLNANGVSVIPERGSSAGTRGNMGVRSNEPHTASRPRLPRHGFFQGFDTTE